MAKLGRIKLSVKPGKRRKMKRTFSIITTLSLILVIVIAFLLVGVRIFGLAPYTVLSGSMEPEYHVGSLIYVRDTSAEELKINDPITYTMKNGVVVTHRIIEVISDTENPNNVSYVTKGDANDTADSTPVHISEVIGKPVFTIPLLGYVAYYIRTPVGIAIATAIVCLLIILSFVPDLFRSAAPSTSAADDGENERKEIERLTKEIKELEAKKNDAESKNNQT